MSFDPRPVDSKLLKITPTDLIGKLLKVFRPEDHIFNSVISDISVVQKESTLNYFRFHIEIILIVWSLTPFSTVFQLYHGGQCTYPCFPEVLFTSTPHNILSKPLASFPHNHCRINGLW